MICGDPPLGDARLYHAGEFDNYFFYPSRINTIKRQFIAIEAMRYVKSNFKLILAGKPDAQKYGQELQNYIYKNHLENRVILLGWISDEEKAKLLANAAGVVFIPHNEEYGYVTIEAFHSHKPVITFNDSGGPTDFVVDGHNGLVLEPSAKVLAEGMERLWSNRRALPAMGERAYQTLADHNINWDYVLENLLS